MSADREKYLERQRKYNQSEKGRARRRRYDERRRSDPEYRKQHTLYMLFYRHRRKPERYVDLGLIPSEQNPLSERRRELKSRVDFSVQLRAVGSGIAVAGLG